MSLLGVIEAVGTDLLEAFGQNVLQEAMNELLGGQGRRLGTIRITITISEDDLPVGDLQDVFVADGHPKDVRREVLQGLPAAAHRFDVDDPVLLPNDLGNVLVKPQGF